jgi:isopentenyl diphosphate isomerase/L-lactate dehydrogenase-like FMN-dependent dehydrogenase
MAPIGVQIIFHPDAEFNPARAGKALGVPFILSTASSRTIEEVAEVSGDGHRWFQLYWLVFIYSDNIFQIYNYRLSYTRPRTNDVTLSLLKRAKENNYKALVVTLDTMTLGWRPHDLETSFVPFFHGVGVQVGLSDPVFMARHGKQPVTDQQPEFPYDPAEFDRKLADGDVKAQEVISLSMEWIKEVHVYHDWEDLKFLRDNWEGPLVVKGILSTHVRFRLFFLLTNV